MKIISHALSTYKSRLVNLWKKNESPFIKYKELREEDYARFVAKCESKNFATNSQYMQWLRSQNELDHHLGNPSYVDKQRKWQ
jgi:hypothetical protein